MKDRKEKVTAVMNGMPGIPMTLKHTGTQPACVKIMKEMEKKKHGK